MVKEIEKVKNIIFVVKLKFESEYLIGERLTGQLYDNNGNLYCDLKNANGLIKEYDKYNGELEFDGEYLNGKRNGKHKEYYYNRLILKEMEMEKNLIHFLVN